MSQVRILAGEFKEKKMTAFTSLFEKPCVSTNNCTGTYNTQQVVEVDGKSEVVVVCSECKKTTTKYVAA